MRMRSRFSRSITLLTLLLTTYPVVVTRAKSTSDNLPPELYGVFVGPPELTGDEWHVAVRLGTVAEPSHLDWGDVVRGRIIGSTFVTEQELAEEYNITSGYTDFLVDVTLEFPNYTTTAEYRELNHTYNLGKLPDQYYTLTVNINGIETTMATLKLFKESLTTETETTAITFTYVTDGRTETTTLTWTTTETWSPGPKIYTAENTTTTETTQMETTTQTSTTTQTPTEPEPPQTYVLFPTLPVIVGIVIVFLILAYVALKRL